MIIVFISILLLLEFLIRIITFFLKKDFQWIINRANLLNVPNTNSLNKFFDNSFQEHLGWKRKKNHYGLDYTNEGNSSYRISSNGSRCDRKVNKKKQIYVFGDSFAFGRMVDNYETWASYLGSISKYNFINFGVGNYGLDQSFLLFKDTLKKNDIKQVVFLVVPETIARIHSYWKNLYEFGNFFAFKPKFKLDQFNNLSLIKNLIKDKKNFNNLESKFNLIIKEDIFYNLNYKKKMFNNFYLLTFISNFNYYSKIFYFLFLKNLTNDISFKKKAFNIVLQNNFDIYQMLYTKKEYNFLLKKLIYLINQYTRKNNIKSSIFIVPQKIDLINYQKLKHKFFFKNINLKNVFDLTDEIYNYNLKNPNSLFRDGSLGAHLSPSGNKILGRIIKRYLKI